MNDDGGTATAGDWELSAEGSSDLSGISGSDDVTDVAVPPGDYELSESDGPGGYESEGWTCVGGELVGDVVTVGAGSDVVCTIVNNDVPEPTPTPTPSPSPTPPTPSPTSSVIPPGGTSPGDGQDAAGPALPETGGPSTWLVALGLALTGLGIAGVVAGRRGRSS